VIGKNYYGQLGTGSKGAIYKMQKVKCKSGYFLHIECGRGHTLASTSTSKLFSMGNNDNGQLGLGDYQKYNFATEIKLPSDAEKFDYFWCGSNQSFILSKSGFVYSCGDNILGSLGNGEKYRSDKFVKINSDRKLIPLSFSFQKKNNSTKKNI